MDSDWSDWRSWPTEREARHADVVRQVEEILQESIIMRDDETRDRMLATLIALTTEAPVRALKQH